MSDTTQVYALDAGGNKIATLSTEQILEAIQEAISTGEVPETLTAFIDAIKEQNTGADIKFWVGTQAEFQALASTDERTIYFITDITTVKDLSDALDELKEGLQDGTFKVQSAYKADDATNVTAQINGKNITDIFEKDGTTVKEATSVKKYIHFINADFRRYDTSFSASNPIRRAAVVILVITNKNIEYTAETFIEDKNNIKRFIANGDFIAWIKNGESYEREIETVCWGGFIEAIVDYSTGSEMCISFENAYLSSVSTTQAFSANEAHTFIDTVIPL